MRAALPAAPSTGASRLPWIIALLSVAAAATTGILLYTKLSEKKQVAAATAAPAESAIVMNESSGAVPAPTPTPVESPVPTRLADPVAKPAEPTVDEAKTNVAETVPPPVADPPPKKVDKKPPPRPVKVEPKIEPKAEIKAPPVSGPPGTITIDSAPVYAVIFIDGKKLGETPLVNIKVAPGKHAVRAVSPSGATKNLSITIESGKTAPVRKISW
jgi:serine/threonine-protein kinase